MITLRMLPGPPHPDDSPTLRQQLQETQEFLILAEAAHADTEYRHQFAKPQRHLAFDWLVFAFGAALGALVVGWLS